MASNIYPKWKEAIMQGTTSASLAGSGTTGVYAVLVDTGVYTYNATHEFYSSLSGIASSTEQECTSKTFTNGVFDHADLTWPSVGPNGTTYEAVVYFIKNAGANTTWRLFQYKDNANITNLPVTANTGNISLQINASGSSAL